MNYGRIPLLVRRAGRATKKLVPFREGADGVVAHKWCFGMRLEMFRVSDHPVCGDSVASRLFIDAAATPAHEEGNAPQTQRFGNSFTPSSDL